MHESRRSKSSLGEKIRRLRRELGLSQEQLAGSELSPSFISLVERNRCRPSLQSLQVMAERLNKPAEFFLSEETLPVQLETAIHLVTSAETALDSTQWEAAGNHAALALKNLAYVDEPELEVRAYKVLAAYRRHAGDWEGAMEALEQRLDSCKRAQDKRGSCCTYLELGSCAFHLEDFVSAERYYRRALELSHQMKSLGEEHIAALLFSAACFTRLGRNEEALARYSQVVQQINGKVDGARWAVAMMGMGWVYRKLGRLEEAITATGQAHAELSRLQHQDQVLAEHNLGILAMDSGKTTEALDQLNGCRIRYQVTHHVSREASVGEDIARCYLKLGDLENANKEVDQALSLLDLEPDDRLRGRLYLTKAEIAYRQGLPQLASSFREIAVAIFRRLHTADELKEAEQLAQRARQLP